MTKLERALGFTIPRCFRRGSIAFTGDHQFHTVAIKVVEARDQRLALAPAWSWRLCHGVPLPLKIFEKGAHHIFRGDGKCDVVQACFVSGAQLQIALVGMCRPKRSLLSFSSNQAEPPIPVIEIPCALKIRYLQPDPMEPADAHPTAPLFSVGFGFEGQLEPAFSQLPLPVCILGVNVVGVS